MLLSKKAQIRDVAGGFRKKYNPKNGAHPPPKKKETKARLGFI